MIDYGAHAGFSMTNLGNLDRIRHNQGFPRHRKWLAEAGFSLTNLGNLDRIRHVQIRSRSDLSTMFSQPFSVTNLGNLDRIRHDKGCLAEGGFSVTNLGNLDRIRHDQDFPNL